MSEAVATGRRWPVISALGIVMIFTWGSTFYLMAILARPIAEDTGWGLGVVTGALSAALLTAGLASPFVGRRIAQLGGRPVLATGCVLIAAGLSCVALSQAPWMFWAGWIILGLGMSAGLYDPAFAALGRLYGTGARSAITMLTLWGGLASTVCWPLSALMLEAWGWRGVAGVYAGICVFLLLPLILLVVPSVPRRPAERPDRSAPVASVAGPERAFLLWMSVGLVVHGLIMVAMSTWLFSFLQAQGMSLAAAVALGTLIGPAQVAGRMLEMAGGGRHHPIWTLTASVLAMAGGLILLALELGLPAIALILFAGGNGLMSIARGSLPLEVFGPDRFPAMVGRLARPALAAQASAPLLGAWAIEAFGAGVTLWLVTGLALLNAAILVLIRRAVRRG